MGQLLPAILEPAAVIFAAALGALATLLTGIAAVGAAWWVGREQMVIQRTQTEIQSRQAEILAGQLSLERARAKVELYDRRLHVYSAVRAWLAQIYKDRAVPGGSLNEEFKEAVDRSAFLFPRDVHAQLLDLMLTGANFAYHDAAYSQTGKDDHWRMSERHFGTLAGVLADLPSLFGEELAVSE